ncbi:MAG: UvrD-helicase domain-containing protein [Candidatus Doudnabacteria bacterium]|nr:UvrD-helicase domain-containing protein [Candidatus Doudnabacteria bacterium]
MRELLENLNKEQLEAVKHGQGPLLIVAGAGTGKTTVITRRIAYLIEQKLAKPHEILALTFTEKAAGEMSERVDLLLPLGYIDTWISTFHSFCERILKNHALDIGLSNDFELLDGIRQWILVYKNFEKFDLDYYRPLGNPNRFIDALLSHFSRCKDELISPDDYLKYAESSRLKTDQVNTTPSRQRRNIPPILGGDEEATPSEVARLEEVANAYHTYQKLLLDNNYLDFGDLINYTLELFKKRPKILEYYQKKFKYILVDEFQDTNFAQFQLVKLLAGDEKNLVVVGDDDQSIYKFRGASVSNILKFKEEYPRAKQITLVDNYRSGQNILDMAYKFIQANNPDRLEIKLKINKRLRAFVSSPGQIEVLEGDDLSGELNAVAGKILELKNQTASSGDTTWNDFSILIRANSEADELLPVLQSAGIPYTFIANRGLYKKPIIVDVLSYMRLLDNAHDSQSLYRTLSLPKFHLSHHELSRLLGYSDQKTVSLYQALAPAQTMVDMSDDGKKKIAGLQALLKKHTSESKTATAAEMLVKIVMDIGLDQKLKEDSLENAQSRELIDQFYKKIENFEKQSEHKDLHAFLLSLDLEIRAGSEGEIKFDPNLGPESVKVLTVHSAKGLEFKYVFIVSLVDQRFPTREKKETIAIPEPLIKDILPEGDFHLQEERRLFYVAITRAKLGLFLSWAKNYGGKTLKKPSQFLTETGLTPNEKFSRATGKVIFTKIKHNYNNSKAIYQKLPTRFSYSAIHDFTACPLLYKYKHYLKLPTAGSHYQSFGITIHKVFEEFLKLYKNNQTIGQTDLFGRRPSDNPLPEFKLLEAFYEKFWVDDWYENKKQKEDYWKEGQKMLKIFFEHLKALNPKPKFIEQFFKLKLGSYEFVGKIDRADESEKGLSIIDYKTGKAPKTITDIDQLHVYQWAAAEQLKQNVGSLKYWFLQSENDGFKEENLASLEEITDLKKRLLANIEKIIETIKFDRFKELDKSIKHSCEFEHLE